MRYPVSILLAALLALAGCPTGDNDDDDDDQTADDDASWYPPSDDEIQRCCICLADGDCLGGDEWVASCRQAITEGDGFDYDLDCQLDHCANECDFL